MNSDLEKLTVLYLATLRRFLTEGRETALEEAYKLGRFAIARRLGVLDMARIHEAALAQLLRPMLVMNGQETILKAKETFLLETLSPFEAAHRGFRETNRKLQEQNRELGAEIVVRQRAEKALRKSEEHFRHLFDHARRMEEDLRNLSNQILGAQEEERKRISRELHDEISQAMTAVSINLGALVRDAGKRGAGFRQKIAEVQALLGRTMETVHRFALELRPAMLDELGLLPALRSHLKGFARRTGLQVIFRGDPAVEELDENHKTVLFRVAQESLTNVAKHARASRVEIAVGRLDTGIYMSVADNGRSFRQDPLSSAKRRKRLGLLGMQERLHLVNGRFAIKAVPGKGTTVRVEIPFPAKGAAAIRKETSLPPPAGDAQAPRPGIPASKVSTKTRSHYGKNQSVACG